MERVRIPAVTGEIHEASVVARAQAAITQLRQRGDSTTADVVVELLQALAEHETIPAHDDDPILARARAGQARYVVSLNTRDFSQGGSIAGVRNHHPAGLLWPAGGLVSRQPYRFADAILGQASAVSSCIL